MKGLNEHRLMCNLKIYVILVLVLLLILEINSSVAAELLDDEEIGNDVRIPLMLQYEHINEQIVVEDYEENCCWNFFSTIRKLFCIIKSDTLVELKAEREHFFPSLSNELIEYIANFLDPPSLISLALTCKNAQTIFSNAYWDRKCRAQKLNPWNKQITPAMVYIANFWYQTQQLAKLKKAASIGHPASKKALEERKSRTLAKDVEVATTYTGPYWRTYTDPSWRYVSAKMGGYYH